MAIGAVASAPGVSPNPARKDDLVVHHQLLGQPLGHIGIAGIVLDDQFDLLAGNRVAVLLHVEPGAGGELLAGRGERPGQRHEQTDLHGLLGEARRGEKGRDQPGSEMASDVHGVSPVAFLPGSRLQPRLRVNGALTEENEGCAMGDRRRTKVGAIGPLLRPAPAPPWLRADAVDHRAQAIRALRREALAQPDAVEQVQCVDGQDLARVLPE